MLQSRSCWSRLISSRVPTQPYSTLPYPTALHRTKSRVVVLQHKQTGLLESIPHGKQTQNQHQLQQQQQHHQQQKQQPQESPPTPHQWDSVRELVVHQTPKQTLQNGTARHRTEHRTEDTMEDFRSPPPVGGPRWDLSRPYELPSGRLPRLQQHSSGRDDTAPNRLPQQQQQQDEEEQPHLVPPPLDTQGVPASPSRASSTTPRVMTRSRTPTLPVQLKLKIPPTPEPKRTAATPTTPKRQWIRSPARLPKLNARLGLRSRFRGSNHTPDGSDACSSSSSSSSSSRVRNHQPSGAGPMPLDRHESHKGPQHERDQKPNETDKKHHHHHNDHHSEGGLFRDGMDIVAYQERPVVKSARNKHRFKHKRHLLRPAKRCDHQSPDEATEEIVVGAIETVATKIGRSPVLVSFVGPDQGEGPPPSSSDSPRSIRDRIPTGRFVSEDRAGLCAGTGDGGYGCDCDSYPDSGVVCYPYEDQDQDHCGEEGQGGDQTIDDGVVVFREAAPGPNKRPVIYREGTGRNGKDSNDSNSYNFRAVHNRGDGVFCSIENTLLTICSTINRV